MYEDNFILQEYLDDLSICDELIDFFEKSDNKETGKIGRGNVFKEKHYLARASKCSKFAFDF